MYTMQAQVLIAGVFVFPLLLLRRISSLRFTAMLSFAAISYVVVVVIWEYYRRPKASLEPEKYGMYVCMYVCMYI